MEPGPNIEQLKMIQAVITRLAGNSFLLKGWTVTLVAGLTAFAKADANRSFALIALAVVAIFAVLDAYYLALERAYRRLYDAEAANTGVQSWNLRVRRERGDVARALLSPPIALLHGAALVVATIVAATA